MFSCTIYTWSVSSPFQKKIKGELTPYTLPTMDAELSVATQHVQWSGNLRLPALLPLLCEAFLGQIRVILIYLRSTAQRSGRKVGISNPWNPALVVWTLAAQHLLRQGNMARVYGVSSRFHFFLKRSTNT